MWCGFATVLSFCPNASAERSCIRNFEDLAPVIDRFMPSLDPARQAAIEAVAIKHFDQMTNRLSDKEFKSFVETLSRLKLKKIQGRYGLVSTDNFGRQEVHIDIAESRSALALVTIIHESQHLADRIVPTRSIIKADSKVAKLETRAFLRQREFIKDFAAAIGEHEMIRLVVMENPIAGSSQADAELMLRIFSEMRRSPESWAAKFTLDEHTRALGMIPNVTFASHLDNVFISPSSRSDYVRDRLIPYAGKIKREAQIKLLERAWAVGMAGALAFYGYAKFRSDPERPQSK